MPHQNRSKKTNKCSNPNQHEIKELRKMLGMNMREFGLVTCSTTAAVSRWESGDRRMHPILWREYLRLALEV